MPAAVAPTIAISMGAGGRLAAPGGHAEQHRAGVGAPRRRRGCGRRAGPPRAAAAASRRSSQASPARVRRTWSGAPSAMRWCGAPWVTRVVTMSPGLGARTRRPPAGARRDEVHEAVIPRPAGHAVRGGVLAALALGDENLDHGAVLLLVLLGRDFLDERDQPLVPLLHHRARHLAVHGRGRGPRADRVLEGEGGREPGLPHHVQGVGEVGLGLAGEADDDVGGDRRVRQVARARSPGSPGSGRGGRRGASPAGSRPSRTAAACAGWA